MTNLERIFLKHHGISGQKWGVRRYQNEDGTLTEEGKRRYLKEEDLKEDAKEIIKNHGIEKLSECSKKYIASADDYTKEYGNYLTSMKNNEKFKDEVYKRVHEDMKNAEDIKPNKFHESVRKNISDVLSDNEPSSVKNKRELMKKDCDNYYKEVENVANDLIEKYGADTKVFTIHAEDKALSEAASSIIDRELHKSTSEYYIFQNYDPYGFSNNSVIVQTMWYEYSVNEYKSKYLK